MHTTQRRRGLVGYSGAHDHVRAARGHVHTHKCERCGRLRAQQWAYDHEDPNERVDDNLRVYSEDPAHYMPLCRACHKALDKEKQDGEAERLRSLQLLNTENYKRYTKAECIVCLQEYIAGVMMDGVCFRCRLARRQDAECT
jgi:hypothetical protein